jgi:hypothetical protein
LCLSTARYREGNKKSKNGDKMDYASEHILARLNKNQGFPAVMIRYSQLRR